MTDERPTPEASSVEPVSEPGSSVSGTGAAGSHESGNGVTERTADTQTESVQRHGPTTMPVDSSSWWETERAIFIRERIAARSKPGQWIVDVGCGRATMLDSDELRDRIRVNVDVEPWPEWARADALFVCARADALPFRTGSFQVVGSFDAIEHVEDDETAMKEQARVTHPDGFVVTAVPADERLWSAHDEAVGHYRRYTFESLRTLAARADLRPVTMTAMFSYLWLPAFLLRNRPLRRNAGNSGSDVPKPVRSIIAAVAATERRISRRVRVPFGSSLWAEFAPGDRPEPIDRSRETR